MVLAALALATWLGLTTTIDEEPTREVTKVEQVAHDRKVRCEWQRDKGVVCSAVRQGRKGPTE